MAGRMIPFDHPFFRRQTQGMFGGWGGMDDPWNWPAMEWPSRLFDQNFGVGLWEDDLMPPTPFRGWYLRPRRQLSRGDRAGTQDEGMALAERGQTRETGLSEVTVDSKGFKVNLDVAHFRPDEVKVRVVDNRVVVHASHEEREDEHGYIRREFTRSYLLPKNVNPDDVKSQLSADGVLTVCAARPQAIEGAAGREVPIEMTPTQQDME